MQIDTLLSVDFYTAEKAFDLVREKLNYHISNNAQVKNNFPSFKDLITLANNSEFDDNSLFNFNFIRNHQGLELHVRKTSVIDAVIELQEYVNSGDTSESYTQADLQKLLSSEYRDLSIQKDRNNDYLIWQEIEPGRFLKHRFSTLRDAYNALPLPGYYSV